MDYLLAIDAGTTSVKAGLFSPDGHCVGLGREEYQLQTPAADRVELDPEVYWRACVKTVRAAMAQSGAQAGDVVAAAVSSQGETTITLDRDGKAIYPALVWVDNRATSQATALGRILGNEVYVRTGIPEVVPTWPACKILWIRENEPPVFQRAAKFCLVQDYLIYRLTGRLVTDGSISCTSLNYDIVRRGWWNEALQAVGIVAQQLPELAEPGAKVGTLSPEAAAALGLTTTTQVVTGGMDQSVGAIGAGNYKPGVISESTGAALVIQATIRDPMSDLSKAIPVYVHSVPELYLFAPVVPTAGMAFKWLRDCFFEDQVRQADAEGSDAYDLLTAMADTVPAGSDGLVMLPHLMGAFCPEPNPAARGSFTGFTLSHTRAHFVRAVLEGVAFLLRANLELIERTGIAIDEIRSAGGGARSRLWNQIKADVCNRPVVTLANEETALLGDAVLAGVASGVFASIQEGCSSMVMVKDRINPGANVGAYAEAYDRYRQLDWQLSPYFVNSYSGRKP